MRTSRSRARSLPGFEFAMAMRDMKREGEKLPTVASRSPSTDAWVKKALATAEKRSAARARIRSGG